MKLTKKIVYTIRDEILYEYYRGKEDVQRVFGGEIGNLADFIINHIDEIDLDEMYEAIKDITCGKKVTGLYGKLKNYKYGFEIVYLFREKYHEKGERLI